MSKVSFYINKNKKLKNERMIYARVRVLSDSFLISTKAKCDISYWDSKEQRAKIKSSMKLDTKNSLRKFNHFLDKFSMSILDIIADIRTSDPTATFDEIKGAVMMKLDNKSNSFFEVLDRFTQHKKDTSTESNMEKYVNLKNHLKGFEKDQKLVLKFTSFTSEVLEQFKAYLNRQGLFNMAASKNISFLKSFLQYALNNDYTAFTKFKQYKIKGESIEVITLTESEVNLIRNATDLTPRLDRVRDIFMILIMTGQRISDVQKNLNKDHIKNGIWGFQVQKTKDYFEIPLSSEVITILNKYDYNLPKISSQKINDGLKILCKELGMDTPIVQVRYKGSERIETTIPKYELITCHCGRRTFISLLLQAGVPIPTVQKLSNHKNLSAFQKYINVNLDDKIRAIENGFGSRLQKVANDTN